MAGATNSGLEGPGEVVDEMENIRASIEWIDGWKLDEDLPIMELWIKE